MMEETLYRVTSKTFCAGAIVIDRKIIKTAPILKKFKGQCILNLYKWAMNNNMKFEIL